jgi:adenosylcobinamide-GDP ribazoletransferase
MTAFDPNRGTKIFSKILAGWWLDIRTAAGFLTRLPVSPTQPPPEGKIADTQAADGYLARSTGMFSLVGASVGAAAGAGFLAAHWLGLQALACAFVGVGIAVVLTGGLHEDGLADLADGLGGGRTKEDRLRIMRDSRIGAFGALAVVFSVGLRAAVLGGLPSAATAATALVVAGALSRAPLPASLRWLPSARSEGMAAEAGRPSTRRVVAAAAIALVIALVAVDFRAAAAAVLASCAAAAFVAWLACRTLGGHTGDVLGASQQFSELAVLVAVAVTL